MDGSSLGRVLVGCLPFVGSFSQPFGVGSISVGHPWFFLVVFGVGLPILFLVVSVL